MARKNKIPLGEKRKEKAELVWSWSDKGWTARIIDHPDDDGWALSMMRDGDDEPVLVVPWVMGRNKRDPKSLNALDFQTQLKAARDFLARAERQRRMAFRKSYRVVDPAGETVTVVFDIEPDEFEPVGILTAIDSFGDALVRHEVPPGFGLTRARAQAWVSAGMPAPDPLGG